MSGKGFSLDNYVDVAERIAAFRDKHPNGSLQAAVIRWPEEDFPFVAVKAWAYRSPDDDRPGEGMAWEEFPGKTPYTRTSELQNAETSAWGRAIVAALAADTKKGVASAQEVANKSGAGKAFGEGAKPAPDPTSEVGTGRPIAVPAGPAPAQESGRMPAQPASDTLPKKLLNRLEDRYRSRAKALLAARERYGTDLGRLEDLSEAQAEGLLK